MNAANSLLTYLTDRTLTPFAGWPPLLVLLVISVLCGVMMTIVFRAISNQTAVRRAAELSRAQVLAIKLFQDDLGTMFASLAKLMRYTGSRLWHSLPPMLVMLVPFVLLLTQLARWYEYRALAPGDQAIIELQISEDDWSGFLDTRLEPPPMIELEGRALRDPTQHAIFWRVRALAEGAGMLRFVAGDQVFDKQIVVSEENGDLCAVSNRRPSAGWWDRTLHPGESGFAADAPLRGINVRYGRRATPLFGYNIPWWATLLIVSMLAAVLVRPIFKTEF